MKNKELIEILMDMDLEKEVIVKQDFMSVTINPRDVTEEENRIKIRAI